MSTNAAPAAGLREVGPEVETAVGVRADELAAIYLLDSVKGFGPQKFKELYEQGVSPSDVLSDPSKLPIKGKRGDDFRLQIAATAERQAAECRARAHRQIESAHRLSAKIVTYRSAHYPSSVFRSNNPIQVLYVRGSLQVLTSSMVVACVGSRKIRPPYRDLHEAFARVACAKEMAVSSGFALGADSVGHVAARECGGATICCMPCGLDRPFPPENKKVWEDFLAYSHAVFVSEFSFGTRASSLTLRKRNKLIVAFARGLLVSQSSATGGAMNAYRFAREQRKPVATFAADGQPDTSGNALIEKEMLPGDAKLPLLADEATYSQWLQALSSST